MDVVTAHVFGGHAVVGGNWYVVYNGFSLGTIQVLRNQKGGWVGLAKCLRLLIRWVGGYGKMLM